MESLKQMLHGTELSSDLYVTIEGNISCGKTMFIDHFKEIQHIDLLKEPVELWENFYGNNLLKRKYDDPTDQNEYIFQTLVNMSRIEQLKAVYSNNSIKIMERSLHSSFHVFVSSCKQNLKMESLTYELLKYNYEVCTQGTQNFTNPDLLVYIKTTPEICLQRVKDRNRFSEIKVDLEYLNQIHNAHEKWLVPDTEGKIPEMKCHILTIDGNQNQAQMKKETANVLLEILRLKMKKPYNSEIK